MKDTREEKPGTDGTFRYRISRKEKCTEKRNVSSVPGFST